MKEIIANLLRKQIGLRKEEILSLIEIPPSPELGDYAFPCFHLASKLRKNPNLIAQELAGKIKLTKEISQVKAVGAYLNFFINKNFLAEKVITGVLKAKKSAGKNKGKIMTEYCHANTHKAFHIGHARNICIGESLSRVFEFLGYKVVRANYQGDIGMHVARTLWGLLNLSRLKLKEPEKDKGKWLGIVYAKSSQASQDKNIAEQINQLNQKLYSGDKKLLALWKKTRKWSIDYFEKTIYPDFGAKFNRFYFESEVEKKGTEIVNTLLKRRIAELSEGAIIMDFRNQDLGVFILLKSDKTPLYSTKDLALAELQNKEYNPDKILHIVGSEQNFYFKQLIKTIEAYNPGLAKKEEHISYELVVLPSGKMASRAGEVILYDDTLAKIIGLIKAEIKKRESKISASELEKRAKKIALGAVKYAMLSQDVKKSIVFNEHEITRFEGNTGPYLQYSYARASSILKKAKRTLKHDKLKIIDLKEQEITLIKKLGEFPEVIKKTNAQLNPSILANYSFELSQSFNEFYHSCQVIGSSEESFRLSLVQAFRIVIKQALFLLGIDVLEEM